MNRVDKIVSTFTKTIKKLEGVVTSNDSKVESNREQIATLTRDNTTLTSESARAERIANKLREIVG